MFVRYRKTAISTPKVLFRKRVVWTPININTGWWVTIIVVDARGQEVGKKKKRTRTRISENFGTFRVLRFWRTGGGSGYVWVDPAWSELCVTGAE